MSEDRHEQERLIGAGSRLSDATRRQFAQLRREQLPEGVLGIVDAPPEPEDHRSEVEKLREDPLVEGDDGCSPHPSSLTFWMVGRYIKTCLALLRHKASGRYEAALEEDAFDTGDGSCAGDAATEVEVPVPPLPSVHRINSVEASVHTRSATGSMQARMPTTGVCKTHVALLLHTPLGRRFLLAGIPMLINNVMQLLIAISIGRIVSFVDCRSGSTTAAPTNHSTATAAPGHNSTTPAPQQPQTSCDSTDGVWLIFLIVFLSMVQAFCFQRYLTILYSASIQYASYCTKRLAMASFRDAFQTAEPRVTNSDGTAGSVAHHGRAVLTESEALTIATTDIPRIQEALIFLHNVYGHPFIVITTFFALVHYVGWLAASLGLVSLVMVIPVNKLIARQQKGIQESVMSAKSRRVALEDTLLSNARFVKMRGLENILMSAVGDARSVEEKHMKASVMWMAVNTLISNVFTGLLFVAVFSVLVAHRDEGLEPASIVPAVALLNICRFPVWSLPALITNIIRAVVSARRIERFGLFDHFSDDADEASSRADPTADVPVGTVAADDATISYRSRGPTGEPRRPDNPLLQFVSFRINPADLVVVTGPVGSGKSALLRAIQGTMDVWSGRLSPSRASNIIAYCGPDPWVRNSSLKENILCGRPFDRNRYVAVLDACQLQADLVGIGGDDILLGEAGSSLSGGQRMRVALARACYSNADIYLLDGVLNCLDGPVATAIIKRAFGLLLQNKTIILSLADLAVQRAYFPENLPREVRHFVVADGRVEEVSIAGKRFNASPDTSPKAVGGIRGSFDGVHEPTEPAATPSEDSAAGTIRSPPLGTVSPTGGATAERRDASGRVPSGTYGFYWSTVGYGMLAVVAACAAAGRGSQVASEFVLGRISREATAAHQHNQTADVRGTFGWYVGATLLVSISLAAADYFLFTTNLRASTKIHLRLVRTFLGATRRYFETTPVGRLTSLLARDQDVLDTQLPVSAQALLASSLSVLAAIGFNVATNWTFIFVVPVIVGCFYYIMRRYIKCAREVSRIENIRKPLPVCTVKEIVKHSATIAGLRLDGQLKGQLDSDLDASAAASFLSQLLSRWVGLRLDLCATMLITLSAVYAVAFHHGPSVYLGLAVTSCMSVTRAILMVCRRMGMLENQMTGVQRLEGFMSAPQEPGIVVTAPMAGLRNTAFNIGYDRRQWLLSGSVEFTNVSVKHSAQSANYALRNVSFTIPPPALVSELADGQVVGGAQVIEIVGRTGAGKSTLLNALLRIPEIVEGEILVGGTSVHQLALQDLRAAVTYIPQDPPLLFGTLRDVIDPSGDHSDYDIEEALQQLASPLLDRLPHGLDTTIGQLGGAVTRGGTQGHPGRSTHAVELSSGERQLLHLCSALLSRTRLILLDEVLSEVGESETQKLLTTFLETCRSVVKGEEMEQRERRPGTDVERCGVTIMVVTHRPQASGTLADYIITVDDGQVTLQGTAAH